MRSLCVLWACPRYNYALLDDTDETVTDLIHLVTRWKVLDFKDSAEQQNGTSTHRHD